MLVLTRKKGEAIQIGKDIEIRIVAINGEQVKIGVNAPKYVEIHRKEIYLDIQNENEKATKEIKNLFEFLSKIKKK